VDDQVLAEVQLTVAEVVRAAPPASATSEALVPFNSSRLFQLAWLTAGTPATAVGAKVPLLLPLASSAPKLRPMP